MKTAFDWWDESVPDAFTEVETKFKSGEDIIEWVKLIQADALREAAEIAERLGASDETAPSAGGVIRERKAREIRNAILAKVKEME